MASLRAAGGRRSSTRTLLRASDGGGLVRRTVLPSGLRVVSESMPTVRSAALGVWIGIESRDETPSLAGASHYLEHLLFKGTRRRDAMAISSEIESVGGEINAFTTKEYTCFYARVLDADLPLAVDVICDLVTSSLVTSSDVEAERGVILEEIAMHEDEPGDAVHDLFSEAMNADGPMGRPVLGTVDSINSLSRTAIHGYYRRRYRPRNLVVSAAGNLEHGDLVKQVRNAFARAGALDGPDEMPAPPRVAGRPPRTSAGVQLLTRKTEQSHLILGVPGVTRNDDRRFALGVLNAAFDGGMSSRLFQEVREKRGLAYSVYSYSSQHADTGMVGIYAGCNPKKVDDVLGICRDQMAQIADQGISADELECGKGQLRGGLVLGLEDTGSRMSRLGKSELVYDRLLSVDEILARIDAVTIDDVRQVAAELFSAAPTLAVVGPYDDADRFTAAVA